MTSKPLTYKQALEKIKHIALRDNYKNQWVDVLTIASEALASYKGGEDGVDNCGKLVKRFGEVVMEKTKYKEALLEIIKSPFLATHAKKIASRAITESVPPYKEEGWKTLIQKINDRCWAIHNDTSPETKIKFDAYIEIRDLVYEFFTNQPYKEEEIWKDGFKAGYERFGILHSGYDLEGFYKRYLESKEEAGEDKK